MTVFRGSSFVISYPAGFLLVSNGFLTSVLLTLGWDCSTFRGKAVGFVSVTITSGTLETVTALFGYLVSFLFTGEGMISY